MVRRRMPGAMSIQAPPRGGDVDETAIAERLRCEDVPSEVSERAVEKALLWRDEAELVAPGAHLGRKKV